MIYLNIKDRLVSELTKSFDPLVNFSERITVLSDLTMFRPKEDISVWKQKKGLLPEYFTVYFDGEYVCGFDANTSVERAVLEFWKGFKEGYKSGKIRLNPKPDIVETKKADTIVATTPEEKMAAQIVKNMSKNAK